MIKKQIIVIFSFLSFVLFGQDWTQLEDFPGTQRDDGVSFVLHNKAYVGTGLTPSFTPQRDFYVLDLDTEQWDQIATMPTAEGRQYASAFSTYDRGYVFGGSSSSTNYHNDLWEYNPNTDEWLEKTPLPGLPRSGAVVLKFNNLVYVVGGRSSSTNFLDEVWEYDLDLDEWTQKNNFPYAKLWRASGVSAEGKGYVTFGIDEGGDFRNNMYEYDPLLDEWTELDPFPNEGRAYVSVNRVYQMLLFFGGLNAAMESSDELWSYNVLSQNWELITNHPVIGRRGCMDFLVNNVFYTIAGIDHNNQRLNESWKFENPTSGLEEVKESNAFSMYPNPANTIVNISYKLPNIKGAAQLSIYDLTGRLLQQHPLIESQGTTEVSTVGFSNGLFIVVLSDENGRKESKKLVVRH